MSCWFHFLTFRFKSSLRSLDLSRCAVDISDYSLLRIAHQCTYQIIRIFSNLLGNHLREIHLHRCYRFSTDSLIQFFQSQKHLSIVNLWSTANVTDDVVDCLKNLEKLILTRCVHITDASVSQVLRNSPNLKVFILIFHFKFIKIYQ